MEKININALSAEERKNLMAQLAEEERNTKKKRAENIETLKTLQDGFCSNWLAKLCAFGKQQTTLVDSVYEDAKRLLDLKFELYEVSQKQDSHTFTDRGGMGSITIGYNTVIGYDGTSDIGIQKINQYLSSLSKDDINRTKIEKILSVLMQRNKKGELNPTRVMDLSNLTNDIDDELFTEGVNIVVSAQFKTRTSSYVAGWMREVDDKGKEIKVTFRITAA